MNRLLLLIFILLINIVSAQSLTVPRDMPVDHPRLMVGASQRQQIEQMIADQAWAKRVFDGVKNNVDKYVDLLTNDPQWLVSRLQMYWQSHAANVYIRGEYFSHAADSTPAPTVRYTASRATTTIYARPKLADVPPFADDTKGVMMHNTQKPGRPLEWAEPSKTGRNIESINREIMGLGRDAAFLYWITADKRYGKLAADLLDTYMTGIYYRNIPIDLNNGHQQTLVGLTSFEVIHEDILNEIVPMYDFLYDYLQTNNKDKMPIYASALKKWADNIIDNGVPHNNWNLFQANYILDIAVVLEDDSLYADRKGRQYYIDYVLNHSSIRQWSLPKLLEYGFDPHTGIWAECPGYSQTVVTDFANFTRWCDKNLGYNILPALPVISTAVRALPQYLFPSGNIVGFGDTHPDKLRTTAFVRMIQNAQQHGNRPQEELFTAMLKTLDPNAGQTADDKQSIKIAVSSLFGDKPLVLDPTIGAGKIEDYVTPTFYAPNAGWFVQRNGMNPEHSLMISLNSSQGNHMHANGISMELYGKGYTLAPDAGIGSGYFALDYAEYYGQFPSHNTVCVDGISSYPIMKSNHGFKLQSCYPESAVSQQTYNGVTYSDLYFREPESRADQTRLNSIITTGDRTGYYVDIFRSRKEQGGDKMHDYFYHNLGQKMTVTDINDTPLPLQPTQQLAFAGAHLYAYSYIFDQKSTTTNKDIKVRFEIETTNQKSIYMNMWLKGSHEREVFSALSPMCEGLSRTPNMPYDIKNTPTLTFVARQSGEAWDRPFAAIFEPSTSGAPSNIGSVGFFESTASHKGFVGIVVTSKSGRTDYIFSSDNPQTINQHKKMSSQATYSLISNSKNGDMVMFMGNGRELSNGNITIKSTQTANITVEKCGAEWFYTASRPCIITINGKGYRVAAAAYKKLI